jgi:hypothetical protein
MSPQVAPTPHHRSGLRAAYTEGVATLIDVRQHLPWRSGGQ